LPKTSSTRSVIENGVPAVAEPGVPTHAKWSGEAETTVIPALVAAGLASPESVTVMCREPAVLNVTVAPALKVWVPASPPTKA